MPRRRLSGSAGFAFHVINRGVRRARLFDNPGDYRAFLDLMREAHDRVPIRILAYCLMPNHFHFVLWPETDGQMSQFMRWLTVTHSKRWHVWRGSTGTGPVYQGRFKALPVQTDGHFLTLCRYVERNPLKAGLVSHAEDWPWSSLFQRCRKRITVPLEGWPILQPLNWLELVNQAEEDPEVGRLRTSLRRGLPVGDPQWQESLAARLGVSLMPGKGGRPRKPKPTPGVGFQLVLPS